MSLKDKSGERIFPSWVELLEQAAKELEDGGEEKLSKAIKATLDVEDFKQAAKYARQGLKGALWTQFFSKQFEDPLGRICEKSMALPIAIWGLADRVVTLNYDKILHNACPYPGVRELDNTNKSELLDFKKQDCQRPAIWHFHGRVGNINSVIFTAESYCNLYIETNEHYKAAIDIFRRISSEHRLFFVGCSLEDAELLNEISKQHKVFDGSTGPHYALVHQNQYAEINQKIKDLPVKLIKFEDFGDPLVALINEIACHSPKKMSTVLAKESCPSEPQPQQSTTVAKKIALLSANPLNDEQSYTSFLKEIRKIGGHIDHFSLCIDNLNQLENYDYILILSKVVKRKLLIEDEFLCRKLISFEELENQIGNHKTDGLFIFVNQLPDDESIIGLQTPTLIYAEKEEGNLASVLFQLFKKNDLEKLKNNENCKIVNEHKFEICQLTGKNNDGNNIKRSRTHLPESIDPKAVSNFVGRKEDLENICRKLLSLKDEGGFLTIKGAGGIGKTTTIKKIAVALSERGYFEGGITFVDCEPITDSQQFQYKVAAAFNLEQAEDIQQHLRDHFDQRSRLIIIDNFETMLHLCESHEIKALVSFVCDFATIVITTRELLQLEGEDVYQVRQFTTDEALELFRSFLGNPEYSKEDIKILRQDILEKLLDNNPLAIKLITGNMPKGKSLAALKNELETDLFSKIDDEELNVFDGSSDLNIAKKKSLYCSILYSYRHLSENEKMAFELLSLFPDGIGFEIFKELVVDHKKNKTQTKGFRGGIITDKVFKALENKSMIENHNGFIKLQSIVGRFAEAQLQNRENIDFFYQNAFEFNRSFAKAIDRVQLDKERIALALFNSQQNNFLKSISYCHLQDADDDGILNYFAILSSAFISISSMKRLIYQLSEKVNVFKGINRTCLEVMLIKEKYFDGDFDGSYEALKRLIPIESISSFNRQIEAEKLIAEIALNIHSMEGEPFLAAKYCSDHRMAIFEYCAPLFLIGEYNQQLLDSNKVDFFTLEVMANMRGLAAIGHIGAYLSELHEKSHLERMQVSYTCSKLKPLKKHEIKPLVIVNPYTRGLKCLMIAFIEDDATKAQDLYQDAITHLAHIKYYYVEAMYYYSKFLQKNNSTEFDDIYLQGYELSQKHHFRFLQYQFEELLDSKGIPYNPKDYPLPDNYDFSEYLNFLISENNEFKSNKIKNKSGIRKNH